MRERERVRKFVMVSEDEYALNSLQWRLTQNMFLSLTSLVNIVFLQREELNDNPYYLATNENPGAILVPLIC